MSNGIGCKCAARSAGECCCEDVDWTPEEAVRLREELDALKCKIRAEIDWLESRRNCGGMTTLGMVQEGLRAMLTKPAETVSPADSP